MTSPADEIDELAEYISTAARVDKEVVSDLLWRLYHKASDYAVERIQQQRGS